MRALVVAAVMCVSSLAMAKGKGAAVTLDFKQVPIGDVAKMIADTGRVNIVFAEGADTKIDVLANRVPWDDVLADVVARAGLAYVREGNVYIVGSKETIDARKAAKKKAASGPSIELDVVGASAKDAAALLATATNTAFELDGGTEATLRLRRVSLSVAKDVLVVATHATVVPAPTKRASRAKGVCAAPKLTAGELELVGVAAIGIKRWALLGTKTSPETFIVSSTDCVGIEQAKVKTIGPNYMEIADQKPLELYPAKLP